MPEKPPNPGSDEAVALGCRCPVMDNGRGRGAYGGIQPPVFWINEACPLHAASPTPQPPQPPQPPGTEEA